MKLLVAIKRVIDPYVKIEILSDKSGVQTNQVKMAMNPFDEIAVEEAIRLKEAGIVTEVVVVSIGNETVTQTLRAALSLGADRALHILCTQTLESLAIAHCLKKIVEQEQPAFVLLGKQAIDDDLNQTGQMLAALLNWPQATFASKVRFSPDKKSVDITREVDGGLETLTVQLPLVITTDLRLNEPRYATLPNIMQAKKKPIETILVDSLNLNLKNRLTLLEVTPPKPREGGKTLKDVKELMHYLRNVEKVI